MRTERTIRQPADCTLMKVTGSPTTSSGTP